MNDDYPYDDQRVHQHDYLPFECVCGRMRLTWVVRRRIQCEKCERAWAYSGPRETQIGHTPPQPPDTTKQ